MTGEVRFGRYRFAPRTGRLWRGHQERKLTPKAAAVLAELVAQAGEPVSRDTLFGSVWADAVVSESALTACIRELRRVLGDHARKPRYIETRHRRGYRFVAPVATAAAGTPAAELSSIVTVGREVELGELHACLDRARQGQRQIVFVTGEPGIGKTTLVEAWLAETMAGGGILIGQGRCIEAYGAGEPYLPVLDAMMRLCRGSEGHRVQRVLRERAPSWLAQMPSLLTPAELTALGRRTAGAAPERMLREAAEAVEELAAETVVVIWLEDLHWSDASTVAWLGYLAQRPEPARLIVVGSYRPVDVLGRRHPLVTLKNELEIHGACREIAVSSLDEAAVARYLACRLSPSAFGEDLAALLQQRTGGNPLFAVSVVDDLDRRGALAAASTPGTPAALSALVQETIPDDLRRLIADRVDALPDRERRVLESAAAAGERFAVAVAAAAAEIPADEVEELCAHLAWRQAFLVADGVEEWPDGTVTARYAFRHALHREVVCERIGPGRQVELHRRVGLRIEAAFGAAAVLLAGELAMHFERARDIARAVRYRQRAGEVASRRNAPAEAIAHLTRALELWGSLPDAERMAQQELALRIALGGPLMAVRGRGAPEVEQTYRRARELCHDLGATPELFPALWGLFLHHRSRGEIALASQLAEQLLELARRAGDSGLLLEAHHALWAVLFARGELAAAARHGAQAIALYQPDRHAALADLYGNHDPGVCGLGYGAWALELLGDHDAAARRLDEALALARKLGHAFSEAHALLHAARVHHLRGDWRSVLGYGDQAALISRDRGFQQLSAWSAMMRGWALVQGGDLEAGVAGLERGLASLRALGSADLQTYFLGLLAEACASAGRGHNALVAVTEALEAVDRTGERFYAAELHRLHGEIRLRTGGGAEAARPCFTTALRLAREQSARTLERRILRSLGELAPAKGAGAWGAVLGQP